MYLQTAMGQCAQHDEEAYDAQVFRRMKDLYLAQHIGGGVATVKGGDGCALSHDLASLASRSPA